MEQITFTEAPHALTITVRPRTNAFVYMGWLCMDDGHIKFIFLQDTEHTMPLGEAVVLHQPLPTHINRVTVLLKPRDKPTGPALATAVWERPPAP